MAWREQASLTSVSDLNIDKQLNKCVTITLVAPKTPSRPAHTHLRTFFFLIYWQTTYTIRVITSFCSPGLTLELAEALWCLLRRREGIRRLSAQSPPCSRQQCAAIWPPHHSASRAALQQLSQPLYTKVILAASTQANRRGVSGVQWEEKIVTAVV